MKEVEKDGLYFIEVTHLKAIANCIYAGVMILCMFGTGKTARIRLYLAMAAFGFISALIYPFALPIVKELQIFSNALRWALYLFLPFIAVCIMRDWNHLKKGT